MHVEQKRRDEQLVGNRGRYHGTGGQRTRDTQDMGQLKRLGERDTAFNTTFIHIIIIYSTKTVGNLGEGTNVGMVDALAGKKSNLLTSLLFSFMALGETASMSLQV